MKRTSGKVSNQVATPSVPSHSDFPEIEKLTGTFRITVKVDETDEDGNVKGEKVLYENKEEPFEYYKVPSLLSALRLEGAKMDDSQAQFLQEALSGSKETGTAVASLLEVYNDYQKTSAQRRQYSSVLNDKTPLTDDNRDNAMASTIRNFVKTAGVSPEVAIGMLKGLSPSPLSADYTVARFLANKGKR
jgi:hypothetical protein